MLYGTIERTHGINPSWHIEVEGFGYMRYMDYTKAGAIREFRRLKGLTGKRIHWIDMSLPTAPKNLMDALQRYWRICAKLEKLNAR